MDKVHNPSDSENSRGTLNWLLLQTDNFTTRRRHVYVFSWKPYPSSTFCRSMSRADFVSVHAYPLLQITLLNESVKRNRVEGAVLFTWPSLVWYLAVPRR
jgi:hypothetical protein